MAGRDILSDIRGSSVAGYPRPQMSFISLSYTSGVSAPPLLDPFPRHPNHMFLSVFYLATRSFNGLFISLSLLDLRIYIQERAPFLSKQTHLTTDYKSVCALHNTAITFISATSGKDSSDLPAALPGYTATPSFVPGRGLEDLLIPYLPARLYNIPSLSPDQIISYTIRRPLNLAASLPIPGLWISPDRPSQ